MLSTQYGVTIALYQICISDTNGQSVEKCYDFRCNWRSLKPFLSRVMKNCRRRNLGLGTRITSFFVLLKQTVWRLEQKFDRLSIVGNKELNYPFLGS